MGRGVLIVLGVLGVLLAIYLVVVAGSYLVHSHRQHGPSTVTVTTTG